ncbi:MAG: peptidoglycan binding domain-containing protein [Syntrophomonadaceae bacterium]|nr:peptidoglycan binding domain-containing protein [Syntrophomonadaceae bacterium]MDD3023483.1 peptidoglycan binding domain-containing protein [Syntrophomonadaceae bacterium]
MTDARKLSFKVIFMAAAAIAATLIIVSLALAGRDAGRYPSNVSVAGVSVANLEIEEARELLNKDMAKNWGNNLILDINGRSIPVPLEDIGIRYDLTATLEKADKLLYDPGKKSPIFQHSLIRGEAQEISPVFIWDKEKLFKKLLELKKENDQVAINARIIYHNEYLEYKAHKNGYTIKVDSSMENIAKSLDLGFLGPVKIDSSEILSRVRIEDIETVKDNLSVNASRINISEDETKAILDRLNGIIIMPEEKLSLFSHLNDSTNGEHNEHISLPLAIQEQIQNSILKACRQAGLDTTANIIENKLEHPVLLALSIEANTLLVRIIGCQTDPRKEIKLLSENEEILPQVIIKTNYRLSPQQRIVKQEGTSGWIKRTYRVVIKDGKDVEKGLLSEQYFPPTDTLIQVGPGSIKK